MATSAFKSTTKRTSIGGGTPSASTGGDRSVTSTNQTSSVHRRSRSVSRFSHRIPPESTEFGETPAPRGKFVNTVRGSGFPEINLDDLAIELFTSSELAGRGRSSEVWTPDTRSQRRGRSVSRHSSRVGSGGGGGGGAGLSGGGTAVNGSARRRRSVSAVRYQASDSESDGHPANYASCATHSGFSRGRKQKPLMENPVASNQFRGLQKGSSQKDLSKLHDECSSHSSVLTEDEASDVPCNTDGTQKRILADYAQKKAGHPNSYGMNNVSYGTMSKELINAVQEIKQELQQVKNIKDSSKLDDRDVLEAVSTIRKSYATKLEKSELRKKELLAEMMLEGQRGKELKKIVGKLVLDPKEASAVKSEPRSRKRSNNKKRISKQLNEEADKIIDDFISSFEDTDISSFDGERSETSSIIGTMKPTDGLMPYRVTESVRSPPRSDNHPVEMDGVVLPWLQWETNNDASPLPCQTSQIVVQGELEEICTGQEHQKSVHSESSRGSWSPIIVDNVDSEEIVSMTAESDSRKSSHILSTVPRRRRFDIDSYLKSPSNEDFLFETRKNQERISGGRLLLCHGSFGIVL
ncbi:hypothetical protein Dimus_023721 [Dionaea muscipula]